MTENHSTMMDVGQLLDSLLKVSEKAANIARACRQDDVLFQLLVQEKLGDDKNPRFVRDFKTLADVLIQETIRHDIHSKFPELATRVRGEETNVFTNTLGESVVVQVCPTASATRQVLVDVLDGDFDAAQLLAKKVHENVKPEDVPIDAPGRSDTQFLIDTDDLGIWIDPIDSTADYISGEASVDEDTGLYLGGLRCVTVLIGAYKRSTGLPVLGVINQPFYTCENSQWRGRCYWGYMDEAGGTKISFELPAKPSRVLLLGRNEDPRVKAKLTEAGFKTIEIPGAGHKILSVAIGSASAYVLSKPTTFQWDTCAAHAILRSLGGGIVDYDKLVNTGSEKTELLYSGESESFANRGGLVAYRDLETLEAIKRALK